MTGAEVVETRNSVVVLAGDRAWKFKRPVVRRYFDARDVAARRALCADEVRLNRRLAPDVYLGVEEHDGEPCVAMRRLPADRLLPRVADAGAALAAFAGRLAAFHAAARTGLGVDEHASSMALERHLLDNFAELGEAAPTRCVTWGPAFLRDAAPRLRARIAAGRVREGHGDLHASNVYVVDGEAVAIDCLEFSRPLRCVDVAADLAFLSMDLEHHGRADEAETLLAAYEEAAEDDGLRPLLPYYKMQRALVRGFADERNGARYLLTAWGVTLAPALVLLCGLPGTGKSTAARAVASALGAATLASDLLRRELTGRGPDERWDGAVDGGPYAPAWTDRTYAALLAEAERRLARGRSVVCDATFPTPERRAPFEELAARTDARFAILYLDPPADVVRARLAQREGGPSDATVEIHDRAKSTFVPPTEAAATLPHRSPDKEPPLPPLLDLLTR